MASTIGPFSYHPSAILQIPGLVKFTFPPAKSTPKPFLQSTPHNTKGVYTNLVANGFALLRGHLFFLGKNSGIPQKKRAVARGTVIPPMNGLYMSKFSPMVAHTQ